MTENSSENIDILPDRQDEPTTVKQAVAAPKEVPPLVGSVDGVPLNGSQLNYPSGLTASIVARNINRPWFGWDRISMSCRDHPAGITTFYS